MLLPKLTGWLIVESTSGVHWSSQKHPLSPRFSMPSRRHTSMEVVQEQPSLYILHLRSLPSNSNKIETSTYSVCLFQCHCPSQLSFLVILLLGLLLLSPYRDRLNLQILCGPDKLTFCKATQSYHFVIETAIDYTNSWIRVPNRDIFLNTIV